MQTYITDMTMGAMVKELASVLQEMYTNCATRLELQNDLDSGNFGDFSEACAQMAEIAKDQKELARRGLVLAFNISGQDFTSEVRRAASFYIFPDLEIVKPVNGGFVAVDANGMTKKAESMIAVVMPKNGKGNGTIRAMLD